MKILLIAYEFPPSPSPQSLRWVYLSQELVRHGHDVHVLTPDLGPELEPSGLAHHGLTMHRTYAGPMRGFIAWHRRRRQRRDASTVEDSTPSSDATSKLANARRVRTPLKVRAVNAAYRLSEWVWFPDVRGEWYLFARSRLKKLLREPFDVVISSHEPATCLQLGLDATRIAPVRWLADMGDPVLARYTPRRWRKRALKLEAKTCHVADAVTVTAESARDLLVKRHAPSRLPVVITQGFTPRNPTAPPPRAGRLELAYAGSFYSFRRAEALFDAVAATPNVRLSVATVQLPTSLRSIADSYPDKFRLLGFLSHADALALQRDSHVLVNIANADASQVPGKLYEYFGSHRPILHITHGGEDPGADLVGRLGRGWVVHDDRTSIERWLECHVTKNDVASDISLSSECVETYSWPALGRQLDELLTQITTT